jgi:hypothetical protein
VLHIDPAHIAFLIRVVGYVLLAWALWPLPLTRAIPALVAAGFLMRVYPA